MKAKAKLFPKDIILSQAFVLGFTAMAIQIVLLREFLLVFYGNELIVGIIIALWMTVTAAGVITGNLLPAKTPVNVLLLFFAASGLFSALFIEIFRNIVFPFGVMPGLFEVIGYSLPALIIVCMTNGIIFGILNKKLKEGEKGYRKIYAYESLGSLAGSAIVSLLFIAALEMNNFSILSYVIVINFLSVSLFYLSKKEFVKWGIVLILSLTVAVFNANFSLNRYAKRKLFHNQKIISTVETPLGNITVTRNGNQINVFTNGQLTSSSEEISEKEESVHYAMLQRPNAKKVLQLGGGLTGINPEIFKYKNVELLIHIELVNKYFNYFTHNKSTYQIAVDPVVFLQNDTIAFDVVLMLEPPPENAGTNRFYTVEFFRKVKRRLSPNGILSLRLPASENYLDDDELYLHSIIYKSLKSVFKNVVIVPAGNKNYFLASGGNLTLHYQTLYKRAGIKNIYVNPGFIKDNLLSFRNSRIMEQLIRDVPLNRDYKPGAYYFSLKHWLNYYSNGFYIVIVPVILLLLFFLIFSNCEKSYMFAAGFASASSEIVLLTAFQVLFGYLYYFLGILVTVFMAGLSAGALQKRIAPKNPSNNMAFLGITILTVIIFLLLIKNLGDNLPVKTVLSLFIFIIAFFNGNMYRIFTVMKKSSKDVAKIYSSDLTGAMAGGFISAIWLIPCYGIISTLWINVFLIFSTLLVSQIIKSNSCNKGFKRAKT
jgi:spermidine synthase